MCLEHAVEFDLDDGPVVDAVVPSLFLLSSESNNMYVFVVTLEYQAPNPNIYVSFTEHSLPFPIHRNLTRGHNVIRSAYANNYRRTTMPNDLLRKTGTSTASRISPKSEISLRRGAIGRWGVFTF